MNKINNDLEDSIHLSFPDLLDKKFEIFSSHVRLSIMLILHSYQKVKITDLQKAFSITSGKLEHHINALENDELLKKEPDFFNKRVLTAIKITEKGEQSLHEYLDKMKDVLKGLED